MNLAAMLMKNEESEDIAVTCRGQSMTYNGLSRHVKALAASVPCQEAAIGIWMDNSIFYLEAYFAIIYSGNIVVPLNPKLRRFSAFEFILVQKEEGDGDSQRPCFSYGLSYLYFLARLNEILAHHQISRESLVGMVD